MDMALVESNDDIVLIMRQGSLNKDGYCRKCATRKLNILKIYSNVEKQQSAELIKKYKIRTCSIRCDCEKKEEQ